MIAHTARRAAAIAGVAVLAWAGGPTGTSPAVAAAATPAADAAEVRLAGPLQPPAPDARTVATVTIPLSITNTSANTLYDVRVQAIRSAPITNPAQLQTAFGGDAVEPSGTTQTGPAEALPAAIPPGGSATFSYVVDSSSDPATGICLCFLGVYAVDLDVTAGSSEGGRTSPVGRTQTYLPSLTADQTEPVTVGWLWPLLDRPHREVDGSVFTDDDLAAAVGAGGRLDRALRAVEDVDAADPGATIRMLLVLDPEIIDELAVMAQGYTVTDAAGARSAGTGGPAASRFLTRLVAVLARHDVRFTAPGDPDVTALAARGLTVTPGLSATDAAVGAAALGLTPATLPGHDLGWPTGPLDQAGLAALTATGATTVVVSGSSGSGGSVGTLVGSTGGAAGSTTGALIAAPDVSDQARSAVSTGGDTSAALQRLVVSTAMTGVQSPAATRFVLLAPGRDPDVDPAAAARAVLATASLGTPQSPVAAVAAGGPDRSDLLGPGTQTPTGQTPSAQAPAVLGPALTAAAAAAAAAAAVRAAVAAADADSVVGDLPGRIQRAASNGWILDPSTAGRYAADLAGRASALTGAVRVVVDSGNSYSLASEDAPLLITVANDLPVPVRVRVDATTTGGLTGFHAGSGDVVTIAAGSRPTLRIPTKVARAGRFDIVVTLHSASGAVLGAPARITVNSSAVGAVGQIVTYGAGILLVLALLVRGVRRRITRSRAGSTPTPTPSPEAEAEANVAPAAAGGPDGGGADRADCPVSDPGWSTPTLHRGVTDSPAHDVPGAAADAVHSALATGIGATLGADPVGVSPATPDHGVGWSAAVVHSPGAAGGEDAWGSVTYAGARRHRPHGDAPAHAADLHGAADDDPPASPASPEAAPRAESGSVGPADTGRVAPGGPDDDSSNRRLLTSSRTMAIASLVSRVTGLLRTAAIAAALGSAAVGVANPYNTANSLPNMVYELLVGGVLSSVLIP